MNEEERRWCAALPFLFNHVSSRLKHRVVYALFWKGCNGVCMCVCVRVYSIIIIAIMRSLHIMVLLPLCVLSHSLSLFSEGQKAKGRQNRARTI